MAKLSPLPLILQLDSRLPSRSVTRGSWLILAYWIFALVVAVVHVLPIIPRQQPARGFAIQASAFCLVLRVKYQQLHRELESCVASASRSVALEDQGTETKSVTSAHDDLREKLFGEGEQDGEELEDASKCPPSCFALEELRLVHLALARLTSKLARSFTPHLMYVIPTYFMLTCASFFELYKSMENGKEATVHAIYSVLLVLHPTVLAVAFYLSNHVPSPASGTGPGDWSTASP